jgi:hypothetical protein
MPVLMPRRPARPSPAALLVLPTQLSISLPGLSVFSSLATGLDFTDRNVPCLSPVPGPAPGRRQAGAPCT